MSEQSSPSMCSYLSSRPSPSVSYSRGSHPASFSYASPSPSPSVSQFHTEVASSSSRELLSPSPSQSSEVIPLQSANSSMLPGITSKCMLVHEESVTSVRDSLSQCHHNSHQQSS